VPSVDPNTTITPSVTMSAASGREETTNPFEWLFGLSSLHVRLGFSQR
jgi:hypothetical protein